MAKRFFDIVAAAVGLLFLSSFLFFIALRIQREDGGPALYRGERVGLHGKSFRIYKFRTMVVDAEKIGGPSTTDDDPRITKIGRFLRKYKLDEMFDANRIYEEYSEHIERVANKYRSGKGYRFDRKD